MSFKPFDGMQKPPAGPPPSAESIRLKDALKRTIAEVRKLEGRVETLEAEKCRADKKISVLQTALQSSQRQLWDARAVIWDYQHPPPEQQQQQQQPPQQWPPRPSKKRGPEEPGLRVTKASRTSQDSS